MHSVLVPRDRLWPRGLNYRPSVLAAADREPVEVCVSDFDVRLDTFDATKDEDTF